MDSAFLFGVQLLVYLLVLLALAWLALFRSFAARSTRLIGNFWVDISRITLWVLLPLSLLLARGRIGCEKTLASYQRHDAYAWPAVCYFAHWHGAAGGLAQRCACPGPMPYNASASSGSNQGPLNPALTDAVKSRIEVLRAADPGNPALVPVDLVTASASGLDPHISPAAAAYQLQRVAKARNLSAAQIQPLIDQHTERAWLGITGEPRVNVLGLNLALDGLKKG